MHQRVNILTIFRGFSVVKGVLLLSFFISIFFHNTFLQAMVRIEKLPLSVLFPEKPKEKKPIILYKDDGTINSPFLSQILNDSVSSSQSLDELLHEKDQTAKQKKTPDLLVRLSKLDNAIAQHEKTLSDLNTIIAQHNKEFNTIERDTLVFYANNYIPALADVILL